MNKTTLLYEVVIPMANRPFKKGHNTITSLILTDYIRFATESFYDNYIAIKEMLEEQDDTLMVMMINKEELHVVFNSSKEDEFTYIYKFLDLAKANEYSYRGSRTDLIFNVNDEYDRAIAFKTINKFKQAVYDNQ